jgi:hypothetical protein
VALGNAVDDDVVACLATTAAAVTAAASDVAAHGLRMSSRLINFRIM